MCKRGARAGAAVTDSTWTRLSPYLPRLTIQWLANHSNANWREIDGSVVFVDISGFTKLSEHLAKRGRVGAEELADAIGRCFAELLEVAYANGGSLLKFGGDALFLLFHDDGHQERACAAAVAMRRTLRAAGRIDVPGLRLSLRMSIGINSGLFHLFLVGDTHRELIVTGPAATEVFALESTANAGEILIGARTAAALRPSLVGPKKGPGWLLRRAPRAEALSRRLPVAVTSADLSKGVSVALRRHILAGVREPEHRMVTVAFLHFSGTDEIVKDGRVATVAEHLGRLVSVVQAAADRHSVSFLGTDGDSDGGKIILAAGAPSNSGDDEGRMLRALRDVLDVPHSLPVQIGVHRGAVFAGEIGPAYRRTYTVMGDAVNLAARLMANAGHGELLASRDVVTRSSTRFATIALEPFLVKGKQHPIHTFRVGGVARSDAIADADRVAVGEAPLGLPFVGRDDELLALVAAAGQAMANKGSVVQLIGEPGIGKSRLIAELLTRTTEMVQLAVVCDAYESVTPYFPFRTLLRGALRTSSGLSGPRRGH